MSPSQHGVSSETKAIDMQGVSADDRWRYLNDLSEVPLQLTFRTRRRIMGGPYGYDVEFVLVVGVCFMLFLIVGAIIEIYMEAKEKRRSEPLT